MTTTFSSSKLLQERWVVKIVKEIFVAFVNKKRKAIKEWLTNGATHYKTWDIYLYNLHTFTIATTSFVSMLTRTVKWSFNIGAVGFRMAIVCS